MAHIEFVSTELPPHRMSTAEIKAFLVSALTEPATRRLLRRVEGSQDCVRYSVMPLLDIARLVTIEERNRLYASHAIAMGESAMARLIASSGVDPAAIAAVLFTSGTGYAVPSVDAQLIRRLGINPSCRRVALSQFGCAAGVSALALAAELAGSDKSKRMVVLSVELPSLSLRLAEPLPADLVASMHFGDGAAAVLVSGGVGACGVDVVATCSSLLPESTQGGGVTMTGTGLQLLPAPGLPRLVRNRLPGLVGAFLAEHGLRARDLAFWLVHPRGAEVLKAAGTALALGPNALAASWAVWEGCGNVVSASVFFALCHLARTAPPESGSLGLMLAFGAGVTCEMVLLRWRADAGALVEAL